VQGIENEVFSLSFRETIIFSKKYFKNCLSSEISIASKLKHVIQILIEFIQDYFQGDSVQTIYVGVHIFVTPAPIFETVPSST